MSGNITLHPKLGINPRMTFCVRCRGEGQEIAMLGNRNWKLICSNCDTANYGAVSRDKCGKCSNELYNAKKVELEDQERVPSSSLCVKCESELIEWKEVVSAGGVYVRCKTCGLEAVLRPESELAKEIRKQVAAPDPVGYEFESCDQHVAATASS